jgi:hypothetical protein
LFPIKEREYCDWICFFLKKHFVFWQIFTPKKMILKALQIHIGNCSKCFIVLYKHLRTLKVKRQISHAYMWSLVSQFFYFLMSFEFWSLDQCFLFFHFLILKIWQNWSFFVSKFAIGLEIKIISHLNLFQHKSYCICIGLAYQGKDIVLRFIIEYSSLRDFGPYVIGLFWYEDL